MEFSPLRIFAGLSTVLDLAHPELMHHHKVVAYISLNVAREMGMEPSVQNELLLSALAHDLGILSLRESREIHQIEAIDPHRHAYIAYLLLKDVACFKKFAPNIATSSSIITPLGRLWRTLLCAQLFSTQ